MADRFSNHYTELDSPASRAFRITANNTHTLGQTTRALYIGAAGNLGVRMEGGDVITFVNAAAGYHPLRVTRVYSGNTTANSIIGLY